MTVETTTVTKQQTEVESVVFDVTIYEMNRTVFCDTCPNQATGTKDELKQSGWTLENGSEFCGDCSF